MVNLKEWLSVRSLLFTPALKADHFNKAKEVGADCLIIDLEDSIGPDDKEQARQLACNYLQQNFQDNLLRGLRINSLTNLEGLKDILALQQNALNLNAIFLPKTESAFELQQLQQLLTRYPNIALIPMLETAQGITNAMTIIAATTNISGCMLGGADYAADLGAEMNWESLLVARILLVQATASVGVAAFDMPYLNFSDENALAEETLAIKKLGFVGKAAIHPQQISVINKIFTPSAAEVSRAEKIVAALIKSKGEVSVVDGKMIDKPVARSAQRILDLAKKSH